MLRAPRSSTLGIYRVIPTIAAKSVATLLIYPTDTIALLVLIAIIHIVLRDLKIGFCCNAKMKITPKLIPVISLSPYKVLQIRFDIQDVLLCGVCVIFYFLVFLSLRVHVFLDQVLHFLLLFKSAALLFHFVPLILD